MVMFQPTDFTRVPGCARHTAHVTWANDDSDDQSDRGAVELMPAPVLPEQTLHRLHREGKSDSQILAYLAEHENVHVTKQAISNWRKRRGIEKATFAKSSFPWTLRPEHRSLEPAKVIRWHARVQRGEPLTPSDRARYERALAHMRAGDLVIHYDPSTERGWMLVPRRKGVDKGIVREPDAPSRARA